MVIIEISPKNKKDETKKKTKFFIRRIFNYIVFHLFLFSKILKLIN